MAQPLRRQLLIVIAVMTVVVYTAIFYGARLTYNEHVRQLTAETRTMAATVVVYVNQNLATADAVADTASRHPSLQAVDPAAAIDVLKPIVGSGGLLLNALLADAEGRPVAWARPPDPSVEGKLDPAWLRTIVTTGKSLVSPMLGTTGNTAHAIVLGYPIASGGRVVGAIGLSVHLEALERVLASIPLPPGSVVTLTDQSSVVVARSLDAARYVGRATAPPDQVRNPFDIPPSAILTGIDGVERVFGNSVVERGPWLASVGIPTSVAMSRTMPIYQRNFGVSLATTIVILALTWVFARKWLKAFDHLDETARRVSRGDLSPLQSKAMPIAEMD
ncbi:MAG TPA: cache domain-containing protein, partial [Vicinamibacterales bacterium]|nr:cache domain-containing protein [Vicinamibacterales bacterium]